jgi:tetratricopeptide (TPR) repeat protein
MPFEFFLARNARPSPRTGTTKSLAWAGLWAACVCHAALAANAADNLKQLIQSGQLDQAYKAVQQERQAAPKDVQLQFLEAVILAQQGQHDRAIDAFRKITEVHPELPEPYNNLGVLYASKGRLEEARTAFEKAIQTHASYSAAHRNLVDVQAQLVRQTYARALQVDPKVKAAPTQLTLLGAVTTERTDITKLAGPSERPVQVIAQPAAVAAGAGVGAGATSALALTQPSSPSSKSAAEEDKDAAAKAARAAQEASKEAAKQAAKETAKQASDKHKEQNAEEEAVKAAVQNWARAWSQKDLKKYFSAYASNFETPDHLSRAKWEADRELRIVSKKKIQVSVSNVKININGNKAKINFSQIYESDNFKGSSRKSLELTKQAGHWMITRETVN